MTRERTTPPPPRVFVSYAHETEQHAEAVRSLWILLRSLGIEAKLDRPAAERRQDWPVWMMSEVRVADFVLVVASAAYRQRAEAAVPPDEGRGAQFEAALIREEVYADRDAALRKFLPVVLPGESTDGIPVFLGPKTATHYRVETLTAHGIETLLRALTGQPLEVEPPLGAIPQLPPRGLPAAPMPAPPALAHELALDVACSDGRVRCRAELADTMLSDHEAPLPAGIDTIWDALRRPPAAAERQLADVGHRLRDALLDKPSIHHLTELLDRSPLGTVVDIVLRTDARALGLPYELLRLPDGRPLCTVPGARFRRRVPDVDRTPAVPLPGPLKILVAVGAPEETRTNNAPLDIEAEMQAILDAVSGAESAGHAQVRILEVGGPQQVEDALREDQYHVLHLSAHGSAASIELEDEDGNPVPVDAAELARKLRGSGRPLPFVVLSSCAGAAHGASGMAAMLVSHGVDRVLAMQAPVSDGYATQLARRLYDALGAPGGATVAAALALARREVDEERVQALRSGRASQPPEYGVATLLTAGGDLPLVAEAARSAPLKDSTQSPTGGAVRKLRIGELIGRRAQLREALAALRGGPGAVDRFGDVSGVVLTGVGGIGKTALAGRIESRLAAEGWLTAVHVGSWDPTKLTAAVAGALELAGDPRHANVRALLADRDLEETAKLDVICQLLEDARLLLLFDDFERNIEANDGSFSDPGFAEVFERLCDAARRGRLLVTCRHPIPSADPVLLRVQIPALSVAELLRLLLRLPALRALDAEDRRIVLRTIGGHPRLIEFVDAMLRGGRGNLREVTQKLRVLAREHGVTLVGRRPLEQTLSDAVVLGSRDIVLGELVAHLDDEERELVLQAAVSRLPLSIADLTLARHDERMAADVAASVADAVERLTDLTLLSRAAGDEVVVHPWIADALAEYQREGVGERHRRALAMRMARLEAGRGDLGDFVEVCRHLSETDQFDDLVGFASQVSTAVAAQLGELSVAAFLGEVLPLVPEDVDGYLWLADREREALAQTGSLSAAVQRASALLAVAQELADQDPTNATAQRDLSVIHEKLGNLALQAGDGARAAEHYHAALTIAQQLADQDPTNATAQRDLSVTHEKLGNLALQAGDNARAAEHYHAALTVLEAAFGEDDPWAVALREHVRTLEDDGA